MAPAAAAGPPAANGGGAAAHQQQQQRQQQQQQQAVGQAHPPPPLGQHQHHQQQQQQQQQLHHAASSGAPGGAAGGAATARGVAVFLTPERFEAPEFSADACVAELRRYVPLPTAKAELQAHLVTLKGRLVEAINEDYGEYLGLAPRLAGLEGAAVRMRQPLLEVQARLAAVAGGLEAELAELQAALQRRQDAAAARATLELMQEAAACAGKVEKLLEECGSAAAAAAAAAATAAASGGGGGRRAMAVSSGGGGDAAAAAAAAGGEDDEGGDGDGEGGGGGSDGDEGDDGALGARCRMLARVAGEAARLLFLAERGKQLAFVRALDRRILACRMSLDRHLQAALLAALGAGAWGAAAHCLRAYLEVGEPGRGEEALRAGLVAPTARQAVADARQQHLAGGQQGQQGQQQQGRPGAALSAAVALTLERLQARAAPLLSALLAPGGALAGYDLLGAVLLHELSQAVADGMPGVFSPGNPAAFHANYLAGQRLLERVEALAGSRAAVARLHAGAAAAGWAKRWNLQVYFSLVLQDVAGTFEAAARATALLPASEARLTAPLPPAGAAAGRPLRLAVSACLWGALQRGASTEVFLLPLADKFCRLLLQLLVRYDHWLGELVDAAAAAPALVAGAQEPSSQQQQLGGAAAEQQQQQQQQQQPPAAAADGAAAAAAGADSAAAGTAAAAVGPAAFAAALSPGDFCAVCADADALAALVAGPFSEQLGALLLDAPGDAVAALQAELARLAESARARGCDALLLLAGPAQEQCMACVRQLKGISATYRMTSKGPPARHSHYVQGVLQPLRALLLPPPPQSPSEGQGAAAAAAAVAAAVPASARAALAVRVVDGVNDGFAALAAELLTAARKTESSLRRLKKARPGEGAADAAAAAMSDSDKMGLQLLLDAEEHGRQVSALLGALGGGDARSLESFQRLLAAVQPAPAPGSGGGGGGGGGAAGAMPRGSAGGAAPSGEVAAAAADALL